MSCQDINPQDQGQDTQVQDQNQDQGGEKCASKRSLVEVLPGGNSSLVCGSTSYGSVLSTAIIKSRCI